MDAIETFILLYLFLPSSGDWIIDLVSTQTNEKTIKKLLKIYFKAKNCSANCGCYELNKGEKEQTVPLQITTQECMEGLRQNEEILNTKTAV